MTGNPLKPAAMPGYTLQEYLLVLQPHEALRQRIKKIREAFADTYKADSARWGRSGLVLAHFVQYQMMEERLFNNLRQVAMGYPPFKVEIKDFGSFPSHTIYMQVSSRLPVQQLIKRIRSESQRLMAPKAISGQAETKPHFMQEPHITIATRLKPWQYEKAWLEYSHKHFTGRFVADRMLLLKREMDESNKGHRQYRTVNIFEFENMPVVTKQGELFGSVKNL